MKKLVITAMALATLMATPALAQNYSNRMQAAPLTNDPYIGANTYYGAGYEAYASVPGSITGPQPGVYSFGHYQGWDPDPNIRFQLLRDPNDAD